MKTNVNSLDSISLLKFIPYVMWFDCFKNDMNNRFSDTIIINDLMIYGVPSVRVSITVKVTSTKYLQDRKVNKNHRKIFAFY